MNSPQKIPEAFFPLVLEAVEEDQLEMPTLRAQVPASFLAPSLLPKVIQHNLYVEEANLTHSVDPQRDVAYEHGSIGQEDVGRHLLWISGKVSASKRSFACPW